MPEFITIGETCAVMASKSIGRMRYSEGFELRPGGAEGTVAVGVKRLGHTAGWISQLGEDELGHYILSFIQGEGVDVSTVRMVSGKQTGLFVRERLPMGEALHFYYRTGSAFSEIEPGALQEDYISSAKMLHITGITPALSNTCRRTIDAAVDIAKKHHLTITFDPNLRLKLWSVDEAKPVIERLMMSADYVLPGLEEMHSLYGIQPVERLLDHLHEIGCERIILKLGKEGAILSLPSGTETLAGYPVDNPVDLMGAGDAFAAGFIAGILKGMAPKDSVDLANFVASMSIRLPGNIESLPTWDEVNRAQKGEIFVKR